MVQDTRQPLTNEPAIAAPEAPVLMHNIRVTYKKDRGIALIMVVLLLVLMVALLLAAFSLTDSELRGARVLASGQQARQLADVAVNAVISQIRQGTAQDPASTGVETWTSQPGLIRKYTEGGGLLKAYKLYSSGQMVVPGSSAGTLLSDVPGDDWRTHPERYVDLNRPVYTTSTAAGAGAPKLRFPIIDPRAMTGGPDGVNGFSYPANTAGGVPVSGVVTNGGDSQRLPMPVQWLYVLKDGSLGALNASGHFKGSSTSPSHDNPIVGRIAFWADDESSKVNVNTASEPTAWNLPTFYHTTDAAYALYQPANGEFQRYPGHPATTALSPILMPGLSPSVQDKDDLYNMVPKIGPGGTHSATVAYNDPLIKPVPLGTYRSEHLYANLDEFLLQDNRQPHQLRGVALTAEDLERKNFFLTARSRSTETNPLGQPKIAMWPLSYRGADYQTSFDRLIGYCATLRAPDTPRQYIFQRGWADSPTSDLQQPENTALMNYLLTSLAQPVPGFSPQAGQTFAAKYTADLPQLAVEFFDYIRATNLFDGNLIKPGDKIVPDNTTQNYMLGYATGSARPSNFKTYTDPRFYAVDPDDASGSTTTTELLGFPGHGQVTPTRMNVNNVDYQGIGRFPTISEVGLHFICCADNTDDPNNPYEEFYPTVGKPGGARAPKLATAGIASPLPTDYWYSNFPPRPKPNPATGDAPNLKLYPLTGGYPYGTDKNHPGYQQANWNHQLTGNTPLPPGYRRVQARLLFEFFIPAAGYTIIEPDISVQVSGLSKFKVNGQALFPNDVQIVRSGRRATHPGNDEAGGYGLGLKGFLRGREAPGRTPMPADKNWGTYEWQVKPTALPGNDLCVLNYDLLSNFVDINVSRDVSTPMDISQADLQIQIWSGAIGRIASATETPPVVVQTLNVPFPQNTVKAPTLVRNPIQLNGTAPAVEPPSWWTFYSRGCMGFAVNTLIGTDQKAPITGDPAMRGRYYLTNVAARIGNEPRRGCFFYGFDAADAGAPRLFRPQQTAGATQLAINQAEEKEGSDVVQTVTINHGDYRLTAALPIVDKPLWHAHRYYGQRRLAHSFSNLVSNQLPGFDYGGTADLPSRLTPGAQYTNAGIPDLPYLTTASTAAHQFGDFDNGPGRSRDGPFINKPDEGNISALNGLAYFDDLGNQVTLDSNFFSPGRMVPSPVMFGSLPSGVKAGQPWRTLLFRPQANHPGGPSSVGGIDPPDHLLLEYFWMPVVEPYAISEPLSTAGKINLNYQIFPFTNIRRASGLYAVLTGTDIAAVPNTDAASYKAYPDASVPTVFWGADQSKTWHYSIDIEKTLAQFESRFAQGKGFIHPSEICDIHLVPQGAANVATSADMTKFWSQNQLTGDNTRERPYATIYPRVTTRSNTFRVHYIAQSLAKARSSAVDQITPADTVQSEYRGSALIERYLDPAEAGLPDFAAPGGAASGVTLDAYHHFRVSENKKFGS